MAGSDIIRLLPDALANQIAAGEVVQRPSSVVKELLENSIDSGATEITLVVADSGKTLIQVVDNGKGMSETDARMSFERHATSKIRQTEDLFRIRTMGFRGEALASIAAVAQVEMKTRQVNNETGIRVLIEGSQVKVHEPCVTETGTSISVRNLFYNVPARRNFLKSDPIEMKHIIDEFQHVALAWPDRSFALFHDNEELFRLLPGKLSQRIIDLLGRTFKEQLVACKAESSLLNLTGYVGTPESSKKTRGDQFLFINNRFIKSSYINHAVTTAYENLIPEKYTPFYALFIEMDPEHLDINVHPTKTEVKFDDERAVYAIIRSAVKQSLGSNNIIPALDFTADINLLSRFESETTRNQVSVSSREFPVKKSVDPAWEKLFEENNRTPASRQSSNFVPNTPEENFQVHRDSLTKMADMDRETPIQKGTFLQIDNDYIITPLRSGLMIVDRKAAMERIIYEKLESRSKKNSSVTQRSLFPSTITLPQGDFLLVQDIMDELRHLGFDIDIFGKDTIVINGIPADIAQENERLLLESIIEQYKWSKNDLEIDTREKLIRTMARRSAENNRRTLDVKEMEELISQLFSCENMNYTPTGRPTFRVLERTTIENLFGQ